MTQYKVLFTVDHLADADAIAAALADGELVCGELAKSSLEITTADQTALKPAAATALFETKSGSWTVEAYYLDQPDIALLVACLRQVLTTDIPKPLTEIVRDENWVALSQQALSPVSAGRFIVHGSHDRHRFTHVRSAIEIDAGEAFGTAHHETTRGCLMMIDKLVRLRDFKSILDLGCGSAILAIAASHSLPNANIIASDSDAQAVVVASGNIVNNGKAQNIDVLAADGLEHQRLRRRASFDLVLANILTGPLVNLARDIARAVEPGGIAVLSGLLQHQAAVVSAAYVSSGFAVADHMRLGEWSILTLQKRSQHPCHRLADNMHDDDLTASGLSCLRYNNNLARLNQLIAAQDDDRTML